MNRERIQKIGIVVVILVTAVIWFGKKVHDNQCVVFKDKELAGVICDTLNGKEENKSRKLSPENITYKDIKELKSIHLEFWDNYTTLCDLSYCKNLESISFNGFIEEESYDFTWEERTEEEKDFSYKEYMKKYQVSREQTQKFQQELVEIIPKLSELQEITIYGDDRCQMTSLEFVGECRNLKQLKMYNILEVEDFTPLRRCEHLEQLTISRSKMANVRDLLYFKDLTELYLYECPSARDFKEERLLQKAYPEAKIDISYDFLQSIIEGVEEEASEEFQLP